MTKEAFKPTEIFNKQLKARRAFAGSTDTPLKFFVYLAGIFETLTTVIIIYGISNKISPVFLAIFILLFLGFGVLITILVYNLVVKYPKNLVFDKQAYLFAQAFGDESNQKTFLDIDAAQTTEPPKTLKSSDGEQ